MARRRNHRCADAGSTTAKPGASTGSPPYPGPSDWRERHSPGTSFGFPPGCHPCARRQATHRVACDEPRVAWAMSQPPPTIAAMVPSTAAASAAGRAFHPRGMPTRIWGPGPHGSLFWRRPHSCDGAEYRASLSRRSGKRNFRGPSAETTERQNSPITSHFPPTGATGLEPATSGVTGRAMRYVGRRQWTTDDAMLQDFRSAESRLSQRPRATWQRTFGPLLGHEAKAPFWGEAGAPRWSDDRPVPPLYEEGPASATVPRCRRKRKPGVDAGVPPWDDQRALVDTPPPLVLVTSWRARSRGYCPRRGR